MTVDVFLRPSATPGELLGGDGSAADPFHSVRTGRWFRSSIQG